MWISYRLHSFTGFHPDYHQTTDTPDKINYPKMLEILQLSYLSAWEFANQLGFPRFVADPARKVNCNRNRW
jgi:hypothetical protein